MACVDGWGGGRGMRKVDSGLGRTYREGGGGGRRVGSAGRESDWGSTGGLVQWNWTGGDMGAGGVGRTLSWREARGGMGRRGERGMGKGKDRGGKAVEGGAGGTWSRERVHCWGEGGGRRESGRGDGRTGNVRGWGITGGGRGGEFHVCSWRG
jgi:hypothetical protein